MVKKVLCCVVLAFVLGVVPARAASISLDISSPVVAGSPFDVAVLVNGVFNGRSLTDVLVAFGFDVTVGDPSIVSFVDATVNGALFDPLDLPDAMVAGFADPILYPFGIGPGDFTEPLLLATLHFNALVEGVTTIGVTSDVNNLDQGLVYLEDPDAYLPLDASADVASVPEPGTLVLLGTAALTLGVGRRRIRRQNGA